MTNYEPQIDKMLIVSANEGTLIESKEVDEISQVKIECQNKKGMKAKYLTK